MSDQTLTEWIEGVGENLTVVSRMRIAGPTTSQMQALGWWLTDSRKLLAMVEAVLALHRAAPVYDVEAGDCEHGDACEGVEIEHSETYCPDHISYYTCAECAEMGGWDDPPEHPCPTRKAMEAVIRNADES